MVEFFKTKRLFFQECLEREYSAGDEIGVLENGQLNYYKIENVHAFQDGKTLYEYSDKKFISPKDAFHAKRKITDIQMVDLF